MKMNKVIFDTAIVGAGPAGLSAANTLLNAEATVLLIDENEHLGGQIFRTLPESWRERETRRNPTYAWGDKLIDDVGNHPKLTFLGKHSVVGILETENKLFDLFTVNSDGITITYQAKTILIATGAYDLPSPIKGWTEPGVVGTAGAQVFIKSQGLRLGKKVVFYGSHPLMLVTAAQFIKSGAEVSGFYFHKPKINLKQLLPTLWLLLKYFKPTKEIISSLFTLLRARVIPSFKSKIDKIERSQEMGDLEVFVKSVVPDKNPESMVVAEANSPDNISVNKVIKTDLVVLGFGLCPSTDLARQLGCELKWDINAGGWCVKHDDNFMTSQTGIFVAGEPTGIGGANLARIEGEHAGLGILRYLNPSLAETGTLGIPNKNHLKALAQARRFATLVQNTFPSININAMNQISPDVIVCRCEAIKKDKLEKIIAENPFIYDVNALKLESRAGMGRCQGRFCEINLVALLAHTKQQSPSSSGFLKAHFPVRPVTIGNLANLLSVKEQSINSEN